MKSYHCTICQKCMDYEGRLPALYPFCSPRCQMVDLGRWFREQYSIDRDATPEDLDALRRGDAHRSGDGSSPGDARRTP
ncbi:MAG: DNA gyrase inhibitor YacG [Phycisphaerae bacterium]